MRGGQRGLSEKVWLMPLRASILKWSGRMNKERAAPKVKRLLEDVYMLAYVCRALCPGWSAGRTTVYEDSFMRCATSEFRKCVSYIPISKNIERVAFWEVHFGPSLPAAACKPRGPASPRAFPPKRSTPLFQKSGRPTVLPALRLFPRPSSQLHTSSFTLLLSRDCASP